MVMRACRLALSGLVVVTLAACGSSGSKSSSTTGTQSSPQPTSAVGASSTTSGSTAPGNSNASFRASGCTAPSADAIGTAFGAAITKTTPTADNGCLWEAGGLAHSVQVSYHSPSEFNTTRLAVLKAGSTPVSVPGTNEAFVKHLSLPNGSSNDVEYIVFNEGVVQISFGGPSGALTPQNERAVTTAIVG